MTSAYQAVREAVREDLLHLCGGELPEAVLLGLSGGADSSLLLHILVDLGLVVSAAHLHHGIRQEEADRDERFCRDLCASLSVPFVSEHINVPRLAEQRRKGLEEMAREERYDFLHRVAGRDGTPFIVTAHNADDNLETVLFHLTRGTALKGLCGIPPRRGAILRPLLSCEKEQILKACDEKGIPFVTDSTNGDTHYARNYIRCEILPRMKTLNPGVVRASSRMTALLSEDEALLTAMADRHDLSQGRAALSALPRALLTRVLLREARHAGLSPEHRHIEEAVKAIRSHSPRLHLSLPGGTLAVDRDTLSFQGCQRETEPYYLPLSPGLNPLPSGAALYWSTGRATDDEEIIQLKNIYKLSINASLNSATIKNALYVRSRWPGDVYRYGGLTRRIKKLLQAQKTTATERSAIPLIANDAEILWIPGFPVADSARPAKGDPINTLVYLTNS